MKYATLVLADKSESEQLHMMDKLFCFEILVWPETNTKKKPKTPSISPLVRWLLQADIRAHEEDSISEKPPQQLLKYFLVFV